jgi:hypothetical protein
MELRKLIRSACPSFVLQAYRHVRNRVARAEMASPVVQMYINDGDIRTVAGLNNFLSFLAADVKTSGKIHLTLRDTDGGLLLAERKPLNHFASEFVDVKSLLEQHGKHSALGLISMVFVPDELRKAAYKRLGVLASHFFMFYQGGSGAVAMVHPSSTMDSSSRPSGPFVSNQVVDTYGIECVSLYQCNPSKVAHELTIGLQDNETKQVVCSQTLLVPSLGVRKVSFKAGIDFAVNRSSLRVFLSTMPSANSKPMLCRRYSGGRFSMSHS